MSALWTSAEIAAAVAGQSSGDFAVTGVSINSRSLEQGDLFVALQGPTFDGHDFAAAALQRGAAGALIHRRPNNLPAECAGDRSGRHHEGAGGPGPRRPRPDQCRGRRRHRQRRQDQHQGSAALGAGAVRADLRHHRQPQQPVGRAAQPGAHAARHPLWRVRARHEPCRRDLAAVADGAAARRRHHHGRAGAYRVLRLGRGDRRRQGRDLRRPDARRLGHPAVRQSALRPAGGQGQAHGRAGPDLRRQGRRVGAADRLPGPAGRQRGDGGDRRQEAALSHGGAGPASRAEFRRGAGGRLRAQPRSRPRIAGVRRGAGAEGPRQARAPADRGRRPRADRRRLQRQPGLGARGAQSARHAADRVRRPAHRGAGRHARAGQRRAGAASRPGAGPLRRHRSSSRSWSGRT